MKYQKKPEPVTAVQFDGSTENITEIAKIAGPITIGYDPKTNTPTIEIPNNKTTEDHEYEEYNEGIEANEDNKDNKSTRRIGDYVIKTQHGSRNLVWLLKPDKFAQYYEPIGEAIETCQWIPKDTKPTTNGYYYVRNNKGLAIGFRLYKDDIWYLKGLNNNIIKRKDDNISEWLRIPSWHK
jgi:hypothetical protein